MIFADFARAGLPVRAIPMSLPKRVGEEERWQKPRKGRFCGGNEFCNWLSIYSYPVLLTRYANR